jgi:NADH-quinone oxidoreductase subunit A
VLGDWASYLVYLLFAAAIAGSLLAGSLLWSRMFHRGLRPGAQKSRVFESGVSPGEFSPSNFSVNYYLTAMLFIVFDIEIVFLYPIAVNLDMLGVFGFAELLVFVAILAVGYIYVWRKGALEWH